MTQIGMSDVIQSTDSTYEEYIYTAGKYLIWFLLFENIFSFMVILYLKSCVELFQLTKF